MEYKCKHQTKSGIKNVHILLKESSVDIIGKHFHPSEVIELCRKGCINYNKKWCCPPLSELFDKLSNGYDRAIILCMYLFTDEFCHVKHKYLRIRAANMLLKGLSNKLSRGFESKLDGYALLNGSCNLCKPCGMKMRQHCKKPEKMRYSMEATGINVSNLLSEVLGFDLQWYSAERMPEYTSVASCVLYKGNHSIIDELTVDLLSLRCQ